jgi:hypothetical protein
MPGSKVTSAVVRARASAIHPGSDSLIDGELATRSEADLVPRLVTRPDGIVGIESRVIWRDDDLLDAEIRRAADIGVSPRR